MTTYLIYIILSSLIGFLAGKIFAQRKVTELQIQQTSLKLSLENQNKQNANLSTESNIHKMESESYQKKLHDLELHVTSLKVEYKNLEHKNKELGELSDRMKKEFENLAYKIVEKSQQSLASSNQEKLKNILSPFEEKITSFQKTVKENYEHETRDKASLKTEVNKLLELNQKLSLDAKNLTNALKGDVKFQGNWGEVILEKILERSGLREGIEYEREKVSESSIGNTIRPDVIINLPQNRQVIIDSKLSLKSYEAYTNQAESNTKDDFLKLHIKSVKQHIKSLNEKHYLTSIDHNSLDFLILFIPVEGSYNLIMQHESDIFWNAWDKKILLLGPSTLNSTLQIIASLWKQEKMSKNATEIARQAGALYDRFVDFLSDMQKVKKSLDTADKNFDSALHKLQTGKFSMFNRFEKIKDLGAKNSKEHKLLEENKTDTSEKIISA